MLRRKKYIKRTHRDERKRRYRQRDMEGKVIERKEREIRNRKTEA